MKKFPAILSMTAATYFFGFIQVGVLGVISAGKLHFAEFRLTSMAQIVGVLYAVCVCIIIQVLSYICALWRRLWMQKQYLLCRSGDSIC